MLIQSIMARPGFILVGLKIFQNLLRCHQWAPNWQPQIIHSKLLIISHMLSYYIWNTTVLLWWLLLNRRSMYTGLKMKFLLLLIRATLVAKCRWNSYPYLHFTWLGFKSCHTSILGKLFIIIDHHWLSCPTGLAMSTLILKRNWTMYLYFNENHWGYSWTHYSPLW